MYKIVFKKDECIGCGACASECPDNWELVETSDGFKAKPKHRALERIGCNEEAAKICPVEAIKVVKQGTNRSAESKDDIDEEDEL